MKTYIVCLLLLCSSISLAAEEITLRFWQFWPQSWLQDSITQFEQENPGVRVELERLTWADGRNKIITAMAANQAPEVIEIGSTWVAGMAVDGGLKPLDMRINERQFVNARAGKLGDKFYAFPWTVSSGALFYNKTLLKKAGFEQPPSTWEELLRQSSAIHGLAADTYGYGLKTGAYTTWQKFLPFAWSNCAYLLPETPNTTQITNPQFLEAVAFYKQLKDVGLYDENTAVRLAFQKGQLGFMIEEPGQVKTFSSETPDLEFGVVGLPKSPCGKSVNFSGAQMLAITKNAKHREISERFVAFMTKLENASAITQRITTLFPADRAGLQSDFYHKENPQLLVFVEELQNAHSPLPHPRWVEIQEVFSEALERVMYEKASPEEAMEVAAEEIQEIFEE